MSRSATIRTLAAQLRLSVATISEALRDSPRVRESTRRRVRRAAERAGYQPNPLLGAALSAVRRGAHEHYRGNLALIDTTTNGSTELMLFHREIVEGARGRAQALGFNTELFWLGNASQAVPKTRLASILQARGIRGAVLLPFDVAEDLSEFDFNQLAAVQMDHCLTHPSLHTILPDHYVSMMHALERLTQRGYRRIGLCLEHRKDNRLMNKWSAAFLAFFRRHDACDDAPTLIVPDLTPGEFQAWYKRHEPEVIVGHLQTIVDWLRDLGRRVPADVGFFNLNMTERIAPCAGLDLEPRRLGAAAVETVVAMLHRQERGVPLYPNTITLEASWIEGPTLRPQR